MPLYSSSFVEMYLLPGSSGLFSKRSTLGAEFPHWWQTDLFQDDPLHNTVFEVSWDLIFIRFCTFFAIFCPPEY